VGKVYIYKGNFAHNLMDTNSSNTASIIEKIHWGTTIMLLDKGNSGDNGMYMRVLEVLTPTRKGWYFVYSENYLKFIQEFDGN
jgi:hypothetical protein